LDQILEAEGAFRPVMRPTKYKVRSRLDRKGVLSDHHTRPLNSLRNILGEHARVYRAVVNGTLSTIEGVRLSFILREVRAAMEAVMAQEVREAAAAKEAAQAVAAAAQAEKPPLSVNIISIPEGYYHDPTDGTFHPDPPNALQLEHTPMPAPIEEPRAHSLSRSDLKVIDGKTSREELTEKLVELLANAGLADAE
jgi:hypothetical protein